MQRRMLAQLQVGSALEHASSCGAASEAHWLKLFNSHLPERYRASSAFIVDSSGGRSRQIDIAVYDRFYSPLIFPYESGFLVPAESVYASAPCGGSIALPFQSPLPEASIRPSARRALHLSAESESLIYFMIRLIERLRPDVLRPDAACPRLPDRVG